MTAEERKLAAEIGLILRQRRLQRGLTQKALAQQVAGGVDATYIGKIERGDQLPSLKVLLRLSKALHVSVGDFFYASAEQRAESMASALYLEPLLQALHNRGIDGIALIRALLDAIGRHVLVTPPRRAPHAASEAAARADSRTVIPLPSRTEE